ncbi:MAG: S8 family serine peptidase [Armatimonadetes bacterium]|nr:S8 family serine peptidase [Armatimonadota bacterium]
MVSLLFVAAPFFDAQPVNLEGTLCHPTRLMAKLGRAEMRSIEGVGAKVLKTFPEIGWSILETKPGTLLAVKRSLQKVPGVKAVELDRAAQPAYEPNDPLWPDMWHMRAIRADKAWDHSFGSSDVTVAVIDTGILTTHPDLAANIWQNPGETPANGLDDDGNGYIDDTVGYDFAYLDNNPDDVYGHGTACAGLVASIQDNAIGGTGVAPRAKIMCLKACIDSGYFYDSMTVPAYMYAADMGARVLSMSYFSDRVSQSERDAIDYCWNNGVLPVAAAGNSSSVIPYYPGAYENTLSVAAINTSFDKAGFSDFGTWVDVAAPGTSLRTTTSSGSYTSGFGGTSGACPHVAGLAALLFGSRTGVTVQEVRNAIEDTATPVNQAPYGEYANYGLVNAEAAVLAILGTPAPPKDPRVRYVTCLGQETQDLIWPDDIIASSRVYGRGLQSPRNIRVWVGGIERNVVNRHRDYFDFGYAPPVYGNIKIEVDGNVLVDTPMPGSPRRAYPLVEASSPGASVIGGYFQTLLPEGVNLTCTRRGDGVISMQGTIRRVQMNLSAVLHLRRSYTGNPSGTETVYLYDWSSGSYPYGNWVALKSSVTPGSPQNLDIKLKNFAKYIDPEKTMYVLIQTSNDMPAGSELKLDQLILSESR